MLLHSCSSDYYSYENEVRNEVWSYDDIYTFPFEIEDTLTAFDLSIDVEHSTSFTNSNLYVKISTIFPNREKRTDVVSFNLANNFGIWEGDCNSKYCTAEILLQKSIVFDQPGKYQLDIEQYSREEKITGIKSMKLKLNKVK